ncbi:sugar phosphate isomerase/epimerase [Mesobacillus foraminis]|uniref:sugar phosphate isomerase/epimerase family protein n=1 Tax=Mesobacillus foraminis TaxID=279826 RepID=UPI001BED2CAE|nr:sugar phosphate isomerase/epimerase family protein [Mesobacillus foraminis]MBT2758035.1 sugar phosphate isomerase/epimerase [Mesobacillus foraminis]
MILGVSSYSLYQAMNSGKMSFLEAISWVKKEGGEHFEVVPLGFDLLESPDLVQEIRQRAEQEKIVLSNYAIGANFIQDSREAFELEVERVKKHVDIARDLGIMLMRHDVASRPLAETGDTQFYTDLPLLVEACQNIADYAANYGITTSVENHGYYVQASDRVQHLVKLTNRPNFRTTLDIGNFLCVDEDPVDAVLNNLPYASMVHIKDFYYQSSGENLGDGWFPTKENNYLRGSIVGHGDLEMREILKLIKSSGYSGYLSLEFEGIEDCEHGTRVGLKNLRRFWEEV